MGVATLIPILLVLLASTNLIKAEQETDLNENKKAETDVHDENANSSDNNINEEADRVPSEVKLDEATVIENKTGNDSSEEKLILKRSSSELAEDAPGFNNSTTHTKQSSAKQEDELKTSEVKPEMEIKVKIGDDVAVNDEADPPASRVQTLLDESFTSIVTEEKGTDTESSLRNTKSDLVDSDIVDAPLDRTDNPNSSDITDESKAAEEKLDFDDSVDFSQASRRMLSAANPEIIEIKARSEESVNRGPDVFGRVSNVPDAALRTLNSLNNEFGSKRNYPNELSNSLPHLQPAAPNNVYNLPVYSANTAAPLNRLAVAEVVNSNSFLSERRRPPSDNGSPEQRQFNQRASNSYPYFPPAPTTHNPSMNRPPFDVYSTLAKASENTSTWHYPGYLYKPYEPNYNVHNYNPFNSHRSRRYTVTDRSIGNIHRVIYQQLVAGA